eukprot:GHVQ01024133.1.p1 GENE.GHVQ01024133.1~~GHVQ01024133.1.p1  ORF type:complete len:629 (+),score=83.16 GHVQ01024133.1:202-2088(+)
MDVHSTVCDYSDFRRTTNCMPCTSQFSLAVDQSADPLENSSMSPSVQTLLIDNYDSYTYNLYQCLCVINGVPPIVIQNDDFGSDWHAALRAYPHIDNVVISPGPGRPENVEDFEICHGVLEHADVPVLGVCLGHQGLAHVYGGRVVPAPEVMHGRWSSVEFDKTCELFSQLTTPQDVVRYHSLIVEEESLPSCLKVVCWTHGSPRVIMGLEHATKPLFGIQFHPESVGTACGAHIIAGFKNVTQKWMLNNPIRTKTSPPNPCFKTLPPRTPVHNVSSRLNDTLENDSCNVQLEVNVVNVEWKRRLSNNTDKTNQASFVESEKLFELLYSDSLSAFWLDSSSWDAYRPHGHDRSSQQQEDKCNNRFSYMGDALGPLSEIIEDLGSNTIGIVHSHIDGVDSSRFVSCYSQQTGDIFDLLKERLVRKAAHRHPVPSEHNNSRGDANSFESSVISQDVIFNVWSVPVSLDPEELSEKSVKRKIWQETPTLVNVDCSSTDFPFDFLGGYVGYLGYELRHNSRSRLKDIRGPNRQEIFPCPNERVTGREGNCEGNCVAEYSADSVPLAMWMFADRFLVLDHYEQKLSLVWIGFRETGPPCLAVPGDVLGNSRGKCMGMMERKSRDSDAVRTSQC